MPPKRPSPGSSSTKLVPFQRLTYKTLRSGTGSAAAEIGVRLRSSIQLRYSLPPPAARRGRSDSPSVLLRPPPIVAPTPAGCQAPPLYLAEKTFDRAAV